MPPTIWPIGCYSGDSGFLGRLSIGGIGFKPGKKIFSRVASKDGVVNMDIESENRLHARIWLCLPGSAFDLYARVLARNLCGTGVPC